jgi:hypothetical protein
LKGDFFTPGTAAVGNDDGGFRAAGGVRLYGVRSLFYEAVNLVELLAAWPQEKRTRGSADYDRKTLLETQAPSYGRIEVLIDVETVLISEDDMTFL